MQIPIFRWIVLVKIPFLIVSLSAHNLSIFICSEFSVSQVTAVYFHPLRKQQKSKHYHPGVMRQLPSVSHLEGIKPATRSTPKSKCFISAIAYPLLVLGQ